MNKSPEQLIVESVRKSIKEAVIEEISLDDAIERAGGEEALKALGWYEDAQNALWGAIQELEDESDAYEVISPFNLDVSDFLDNLGVPSKEGSLEFLKTDPEAYANFLDTYDKVKYASVDHETRKILDKSWIGYYTDWLKKQGVRPVDGIESALNLLYSKRRRIPR